MPVAAEQFGTEVHMILLRQMIDTLKSMDTRMENIHSAQVKQLEASADVATRLATLEANPVAALEARLLVIENERQQEAGARNLIAWMKDYTPWLFAIIGGVWLYFEKKS